MSFFFLAHPVFNTNKTPQVIQAIEKQTIEACN